MIQNPFTAHVHPYPTRFHGSSWKRPTFGLPYQKPVQAVFMPHQLSSDPSMGDVATGADYGIAIGAFVAGIAGGYFLFKR